MNVRVKLEIYEDEIEGDYRPCEGLVAICPRCGNRAEAPGTGAGSAKYAAAQISETCPRTERNFYDMSEWDA